MPRDPASTPRDIGPTPDGSALRIVWEDGAESVLAPRTLRLRCPCAACVDELTGRRILRPENVPVGVFPTAIHYVGRYALQFVWSDGHDTGFYPFDYLRRLGEEVQGGRHD
jgi:DUF971 family protein